MSRLNYVVGVDVGLYSIGFAAIEVDDDGSPLSILNQCVQVHDAGISPLEQKVALTRLNVSGVARRTRRLRRHRRQRLRDLDAVIQQLGWPIVPQDTAVDDFSVWKTRARLATEYIADVDERQRALSIAVRHMARHRGWRSPWVRVESLFSPAEDSDYMAATRDRFDEAAGRALPRTLTPAQMVCALELSTGVNLRRRGNSKNAKSPLFERLMQSDNANELRAIGRVQRLDDETVKQLIRAVFASKSPKGRAGERAGFDSLPGQGHLVRAEVAHPAFQRFRIAAQVANVRVLNPRSGEYEALPTDVRREAVDFLATYTGKDMPTWDDVAEEIGVARVVLRGSASQADYGERASGRPLVDVTNRTLSTCSLRKVREWWRKADEDARVAFVSLLSNSSDIDEDAPGWEPTRVFVSSFDDNDFAALESVSLPSGRAAYSVDSLTRLTRRMLEDGIDLHEARKREFGVGVDWRPPADPIGAPTGNPAVNRVVKAVNRWLMMAEHRWGPPQRVTIEHVREGFTSVAVARSQDRQMDQRAKAREEVRDVMRQQGISSDRSSDVRRFEAIQRQNGMCLYCGRSITFTSSEMDHIVPRKGPGSTNTIVNLAAVCEGCNREKSNIPFAVWARKTSREGVSLDEAIQRVRLMVCDRGWTKRDLVRFQREVVSRLKRTDADASIDNRSIESVAWMANELADRVRFHYRDEGTRVWVFPGSVTAEARKASGFEQRVHLIGGGAKTRFDRRHHALDASVVALLRPSVARTLVQRSSMRQAQWLDPRRLQTDGVWKDFEGESGADRRLFSSWRQDMERLAELTQNAVDHDRIPLVQNLRLRVANDRVHLDTVRPLVHKRVGDAWTLAEVDRAATPALWCALTQSPDFQWPRSATGVCLPANDDRQVVLQGRHLGGDHQVELFPSAAASMKVRGGAVEVGVSLHHGRLYRVRVGKKSRYYLLRVFGADLTSAGNQDVFTMDLPESSLSVRDANMKLRQALRDGTAQMLGWVVPGDELEISPGKSVAAADASDADHAELTVSRWKVTGFEDATTINLKPRLLAEEGIEKVSCSVDPKFLSDKGWRASVNKLLSDYLIRVIRRDAHGRVRRTSGGNLPVSYWLNGD